MQTLDREKQLVDYLLGELPEEQREELEERFCHDAELFERMLALRDDVVDDYLRGEHSRQQSRQFKRYFMATPQQRETVENARALMRAVAGEPEEPPAPARVEAEPALWWQRLRELLRDNWMPAGLAFAMALLVFAAMFQVMRLRGQLTQSQRQTAEERSRADGLAEELAIALKQDISPPDTAPSPRPEENVIASMILTSDYDRISRGSGGGGLQKLIISSERGLVQLRLKLADDGYRSYRLTLKEMSSGKTVQTLAGLRAQRTRSGRAVFARLPASSFSGPAKDYLVALDGKTADGKYETEIDKYSFRVEKE